MYSLWYRRGTMKRVYSQTIFFALLLLGFFPFVSDAAELRMETTVTTSVENKVNDNLYVGAGRALLLGTAVGDASVLAGESILAGTFEQDVLSVAGETIAEGVFEEDLRIIGGDALITGTVEGDLFVVGANVVIDERAELYGDVVLVGGNMEIAGTLKGNLKVVSALTDISGTLEGRTTITTQRLVLSEGARIIADVFYFAPKEVEQADGVVLEKQLRYNPIGKIQESQILQRILLNFSVFWIVLKFVTTLVVAFILVYMFKVFSQYAALQTQTTPMKMLTLGTVTTLGTPILALAFIISLFALPLGLIMISIYVTMFLLAPALSGIVAGVLLFKLVRPKVHLEVGFHHAALGVFILALIALIPYVGSVVTIIFFLISIGIMVYYLYFRIRGKQVL